MKTVTVHLESVSPLCQSRPHNTPKKEGETADDHEKRTWRERLHSNEEGNVIVTPMTFKNTWAAAAKFISLQIPGKGKATYTKHFEAGILVTDPLVLPIKKDDVKGQWLFVPADGRRGSGTRVWKCFPMIPEWSGQVTFYVLDDTISEPVFEKHSEAAGNFIGIGALRVRNNGLCGRFRPTKYEWSKNGV